MIQITYGHPTWCYTVRIQMNAKSMLLAAAVLATPACAVTEDEVASASEDAVSARVSLLGETFLSRDTFTVTQSRRRPDGEYVQDTLQVRYRLRFIPAGVKTTNEVYGDYSYEGEGVMEYETVIDRVQVGKSELTFSDDVSYYAKRTDGNSFRLFDCDSTQRCADNDRVSKLDVFTEGGKKTVKLSHLNLGDDRPGVYLEGVRTREILFQPTSAAPEHVDLGEPITCTANGHTLRLAPIAPGNSLASIELKNDATGAVVHSGPYYSVLQDLLGHRFVVGSWEGLRISLGDRAARYENEVTGLTLDFASGTCHSPSP